MQPADHALPQRTDACSFTLLWPTREPGTRVWTRTGSPLLGGGGAQTSACVSIRDPVRQRVTGNGRFNRTCVRSLTSTNTASADLPTPFQHVFPPSVIENGSRPPLMHLICQTATKWSTAAPPVHACVHARVCMFALTCYAFTPGLLQRTNHFFFFLFFLLNLLLFLTGLIDIHTWTSTLCGYPGLMFLHLCGRDWDCVVGPVRRPMTAALVTDDLTWEQRHAHGWPSRISSWWTPGVRGLSTATTTRTQARVDRRRIDVFVFSLGFFLFCWFCFFFTLNSVSPVLCLVSWDL